MTPAQQVAIRCRQAGEHTRRVRTWIAQHEPRLQEVAAGLREELDGALEEIAICARAAERPDVIGIAGAAGPARRRATETVAGQAFEAVRSGGAPGAEAAVALAHDLPGMGGTPTVAAVRLTERPDATRPGRLSFTARLIDRVDLVKILARVSAADPRSEGLTHDALARHLAGLDAHLAAQLVIGFTAADALDLAADLAELAAAHSLDRQLTAAGYWTRLATHGPHLPDAARRELLACLWHGDPALTQLFARLDEALSRLGFAAEIELPRDALLTRDPARGWETGHDDSVLAARTLAASGTVEVVTKYGHRQHVPRDVLAALLAEVTLPMRKSADSAAPDLLLLPAPPPRSVTPLLARTRTATDPDGPAVNGFPPDFARVKASYLAERAFRRREVASLVVATEPRTPADDAFAADLASWIDRTLGAEPALRERTTGALFVVAPRPLGQAAGTVPTGPVEPELAPEQDWLAEWTPSRPFTNVYVAGHDSVAAAEAALVPAGANGKVAGLPAGVSKGRGLAAGNELWQRLTARLNSRVEGHGRHRPTRSTLDLLTADRTEPPERGLDGLRRAVVQATGPTITLRRSSLWLDEGRRRLRTMLLRLSGTGDDDWRSQMARRVETRLLRAAERGRLGHLIEALEIRESEIAAVVAGARSQRDGLSPSVDPLSLAPHPLSATADGLPDAAEATRIARLVVTHWLGTVRRATRAQRLASRVQVSRDLLQHMADEIAIGAVRCQLVPAMAERIEHLARRLGPEAWQPAAAASLAWLISVYVETLANPSMTAAANRRALHPAVGDADGASVPPCAQGNHADAPIPLGRIWPARFVDLVEQNVARPPFPAPSSEHHREAAELVASLSTPASEADL